MQVDQENWTIEKLTKQKKQVNLNPMWQRGPVWREPRQVLLIDSILRGMDIPKIYLRELRDGGPFKYDAVDGQQRLRALWEFFSDNLRLNYSEALTPINGHEINGKTFTQLHKDLRSRFTSFRVSVAHIREATTDEITSLFARLQMGISLNPAELRNAILGPATHVISTLASDHEFFEFSKIADVRYKRRDYLTHVMALAAYNGTRDIKAPNLKQFVQEYNSVDTAVLLKIAADIGDVLNTVHEANQILGFTIRHKWIFVDICWFVFRRFESGEVVDPQLLADNVARFDRVRRTYTSSPEKILSSSDLPKKLRQHLYNYLVAFKAQGGMKDNLMTRARAIDAFFLTV